MHIQTHVLSGWCVGNLLPLTARERVFCMIAAAAQDVDGLGILISEELYWDYHHKLGHCAAFGVVLSLILTAISTHRLLGFVTYLALFHLHLVLDYLGSGPGWPLYYFWPVSNTEWLNPHAWPFFSWQNIGSAFAMWAGPCSSRSASGEHPWNCSCPRSTARPSRGSRGVGTSRRRAHPFS